MKALRYYRSIGKVDEMLENLFPIEYKYGYMYSNDWGEKRTYGGDRKHEGIDIICVKGTPIRSVCDGTVEKRGWNTLGGWRVGIRGTDGLYYYYAHLSGFAVSQGEKVRKGKTIGYAGASGYGSEGEEGKFIPHLHFGIYQGNKAINPYPFLYYWESRYEAIAR